MAKCRSVVLKVSEVNTRLCLHHPRGEGGRVETREMNHIHMLVRLTKHLFAPHCSQMGVRTTHLTLDWLPIDGWRGRIFVFCVPTWVVRINMLLSTSIPFAHHPHHLLHRLKACVVSLPEGDGGSWWRPNICLSYYLPAESNRGVRSTVQLRP